MGWLDQAMGSFFGGAFGGNKPGEAYNDYASQIDGLRGLFSKYAGAGNRNVGLLDSEGEQLFSDPTSYINKIMGSYKNSEYQDKTINNVLDGVTSRMNNNSAITGMAGSSSANQALQDHLLDSSAKYQAMNQQNYLQNALGLMNSGLQTQSHLADIGLGAINSQSALGQEAALGRVQGRLANDKGFSKGLGNMSSMLDYGKDKFGVGDGFSFENFLGDGDGQKSGDDMMGMLNQMFSQGGQGVHEIDFKKYLPMFMHLMNSH